MNEHLPYCLLQDCQNRKHLLAYLCLRQHDGLWLSNLGFLNARSLVLESESQNILPGPAGPGEP